MVLLPVVCVAATLAHPQGVFVGIVLGLPILVWGTLVRARERFSPWCPERLTACAARGDDRRRRRHRLAGLAAGTTPAESSAVWKPNAS